MMHVVQLSFYQDPHGRGPNELLRDWPTMVDVADAASLAGARVSVIQACISKADLSNRGVDYHFVAPSRAARSIAAGEEFRGLLRRLRPDVLHVHGLAVADDLPALAEVFGSDVPILIQDHANRAPRWWRRRIWRKGLAAASAVSFCAREQAAPFLEARLFRETTEIYAVPESTSRFTPGDQTAARRATGLHGDPCLLWVGHLDGNKDPLTILAGVSEAAAQLPNMHLWCYFGSAPLLTKVQKRIKSDSRIADRVHLMGSAPHHKIEQAMRAADLFVLGSHREGSGYSLLEAMACGLPAAVTDIPSFRSLTGNGTVGKLWPCGDSAEFARTLIALSNPAARTGREAVRAYFDRELSLEAVGRKLLSVYSRMMQ